MNFMDFFLNLFGFLPNLFWISIWNFWISFWFFGFPPEMFGFLPAIQPIRCFSMCTINKPPPLGCHLKCKKIATSDTTIWSPTTTPQQQYNVHTLSDTNSWTSSKAIIRKWRGGCPGPDRISKLLTEIPGGGKLRKPAIINLRRASQTSWLSH